MVGRDFYLPALSSLEWGCPPSRTPRDLRWLVELLPPPPRFRQVESGKGGASGKEPACQCRGLKRQEFDPWVKLIPWRRARQPAPVFLLGESHGQRSWGGLQVHGVAKSPTWLKQLSTLKDQEKVNRVYISPLSSLPRNNSQQLLLTSQWTDWKGSWEIVLSFWNKLDPSGKLDGEND